MAEKIGSVLVNVLANTASFSREMKKANSKMDKFGAVAKRAAKAAAAIFAGYSVTNFIVEQTKAIDILGKTSDKLAINTERLQELQFAAERTSGVMGNQFNLALQRMTRRTAEAATGVGEAVKAYKELGLDAERLARMNPDEIFLEVADAMRNIGDESQQLKLAFKLFDSEGAALVTTLREGSAGIENLANQFRYLGRSITRDDARKIEQARDALADIKLTLQAQGISLLIEFADEIKNTAENIARFLVPSLKAAAKFASSMASAMELTFWVMALNKDKIVQTWNEMKQSFNEGTAALSNFGKEIKTLKTLTNSVDLSNLFQSGASGGMVFDEIEKTKQQILDKQKLARLLGGEEMISQEGGIAGIIEADLELANQHYGAWLEKQKQLAMEYRFLWLAAADTFARGIGDAVADSVLEGESLAESMKSILKNVTRQVISSLVEIGVKRAIMSSQAIAESNAVAANTSANQASVAAAAAPAAAATSLSSFGANSLPAMAGILATFALIYAMTAKRAGGGPVGSGSPVMVGEQGRELFIPQGAGTIVSNSELQAAGGGARGDTFIFNINATDAQSFDNQLRQRGSLLASTVRRELNEQGRRL